MLRKHIFTFGLIILCLTPSMAWSAFRWMPNGDVEGALKKGREQSKPVFAYFYHPIDNKGDKKVWLNSALSRFSNRFIAVGVNIVSFVNIAEKYGTNRYPTILFFDPQGRELYAYRLDDDRLKLSPLISRMNSVLKAIDEFALVESQQEMTRKSPKLLLLYAKGLRDRALFDEADREFNRLLEMKDVDPQVKEEAQQAYKFMVFLRASKAFYEGEYDRCIENLKRFIAKNPNSESIYHARFILGVALYEAGAHQDGKEELEKLSRNTNAGVFKDQAKMYLLEKKGG